MLRQLLNDECGFIVSAELVLIATILVIGLIVGLAEVQSAVVQELNDVGDAIGSLNQGFLFNGFSAENTTKGGIKAITVGSVFVDQFDECDNNQCALDCDGPRRERPKTFSAR